MDTQTTHPIEKILVRPAEAAAMLSISRSRVYELLASGAIPAVRLDNGRTLRIPRAALEKLAENAMEAAGVMTIEKEQNESR
jgi:excisionase family DNA binding protein